MVPSSHCTMEATPPILTKKPEMFYIVDDIKKPLIKKRKLKQLELKFFFFFVFTIIFFSIMWRLCFLKFDFISDFVSTGLTHPYKYFGLQ